MNRKDLKLPFRGNSITKYQCPTCKKGLLRVKENTFHRQETRLSAKDHHHDAWEPEWIKYIYCCLFECTNSACKDTVSSSGTGSVTSIDCYDQNGEPQLEFYDYFTPNYFIPHLHIFEPPDNTPDYVSEEINKSFELFFCDPASSASHIRIALEHLLTHLKIKRYERRSGRLSFVPLHSRIESLPTKFDNVKELFLAIKWLGNAGSHSNKKISLDDVLDAYELMNLLLIELFSNNRTKIKSLAKKINRRKGPSKRKS